MPGRAFDPRSRGARHLARTWLPHLERWTIRLNAGHSYNERGQVVGAGDTIELGAPLGRQLVERGGGELVDIRRASATE